MGARYYGAWGAFYSTGTVVVWVLRSSMQRISSLNRLDWSKMIKITINNLMAEKFSHYKDCLLCLNIGKLSKRCNTLGVLASDTSEAHGHWAVKAASRGTGPLTSLYTFLPDQIPLIVIVVRVTMWTVTVIVTAVVATYTLARPADGK